MTVATPSVAARYRYHSGDSCGTFMAAALRAYDPPLPPAAHVLEIGCAEYDWLTTAALSWPEMSFTGLDWRGCKTPPEGVTILRGDARVYPFPEASFDWIVSISAMEHIGLGHYAQDPTDPDGDVTAFANAYRWLAPGGWFYFDVPWNAGPDAYEVVGASHRIYGDAEIQRRCHQGLPWVERWRGVVGNGDTDQLLTHPPRLPGGERFYYCGLWYQKEL